MKMKVLLCLVVIFSCTNALANELQERNQIRREAADAFYSSDFTKLEALASRYLTRNEKTRSGTLKMDSFYVGIHRYMRQIDKNDDAGWSELMKSIDQWMIQYPKSPRPYIMYAKALSARAWAYRGQAFAYQVPDADMQAFIKYQKQAADYLMKHKEIGSQDPYWYVEMADFFLADIANKNKFFDIINEGLQRYPDFDKIYFSAINYLTPKWHGSAQEVEDFAMAARERTMADRGSEMYARLYWAAGLGKGNRYLFQDPPANWHLMVKGMDEILQKYPTQWNINHFAFFACFKFDSRAARKYLDMTEEPIIGKAWYRESNYTGCKQHLEKIEAARGD